MYPPSPQRPVSSPQNLPPLNLNPSTKPHDHLYDANRNHIVPYYYSETLTPCMPNNAYSVPNTYHTNNKNRHTLASYPYDDRQNYYQRKINPPKLKTSLNASPELSHIFAKSNVYPPQSFRPYSVLETTTKSPIQNVQRPSSVVPMTDQYRPASFFQTDNEIKKTNEVPEWKARLQKENPKPLFKTLERPLRQTCRIPNCKCSEKAPLEPGRFSEVRTLPTPSGRNLNKYRNLSLPTLKLEEIEKIENESKSEAERDNTVIIKPISEQHLGYV